MTESTTHEQLVEVAQQRAQRHETLRATVPTLERILYTPIDLLDHGFVRVVDYMGDDGAVVQAARVSYGRGTQTRSGDRTLIRYLMRHHHTTPFEMCEIKLHVKLPIFVARQWVRHRTANINEYSARYSILDREFYIPDAEVIASQSQANRQGRGDLVPAGQAAWVRELLIQDALRAYDHYEELLNEDPNGEPLDPGRAGLARELARINLSLNYYTQWYWKTDLHNLLNFLQLQADAHAQYEIRVYAEAILERIVRPWTPLVHKAFLDYRRGARTLSHQALQVVRALARGRRGEARGGGGAAGRNGDRHPRVAGDHGDPGTRGMSTAPGNAPSRETRMKTISLWQPYASLIAAGVKTIETRGWAPPKGLMGQRIAIHAAKAIGTADVRGRSRHHLIAAALNDPEWDGNIPRGAVVCTAILDHAAQVNGPEHNGQATVTGNHRVKIDEWGDFGPGRWLWFLRDVEPVDPPVPARGHQGFWNWER